jgi:cell wall-associated NlpC family hydrolase
VVQPVGLSEVSSEIGSINQFVDGGFGALLAALTSAVQASAAPGPEAPAAGSALGLPSALVTGGSAGQASAAGGPGAVLFNAGLGLLGPGTPEGPGASVGTSAANGPALPGPATGGAGPTGGLGERAAALAQDFVGTPYVWGGESPQGFDCSGLVQYVYRQLGVQLPRTSQQQATVGVPVASLADAQPGDLVFFPGSDGTASDPGHVGIYIGNGEMVDAPYSGTVVQVQPVGHPSEIRRVGASPTSYRPAIAQGLPLGGPGATGAQGVPGEEPPVGVAAPGLVGSPEGPYSALFAQASSGYGLPSGLLEAMADAESGMDPGAVSPAGAEGLMQLMPDVAARLGVDPFDPAQAVPAAASLVAGYWHEFGTLALALAAYNAGPGAVEAYGGVPPYPQTQAYVSKVLSLMGAQ